MKYCLRYRSWLCIVVCIFLYTCTISFSVHIFLCLYLKFLANNPNHCYHVKGHLACSVLSYMYDIHVCYFCSLLYLCMPLGSAVWKKNYYVSFTFATFCYTWILMKKILKTKIENTIKDLSLPIDFIENSINEKNPIPWLVMQWWLSFLWKSSYFNLYLSVKVTHYTSI